MKNQARDTNQTVVPHFTQHGRLESRIENNILINHATGPFNAEIIYAIEAIQTEFLAELSAQRKWAQMYIFHDSALCSPDTIEAMHVYMKKLKATISKPAGTAYVMEKTLEGRSIMAPLYRQVYEVAKLNFQLFDNVHEAHNWLSRLLNEE